jgi:hypothetical protein
VASLQALTSREPQTEPAAPREYPVRQHQSVSLLREQEALRDISRGRRARRQYHQQAGCCRCAVALLMLWRLWAGVAPGTDQQVRSQTYYHTAQTFLPTSKGSAAGHYDSLEQKKLGSCVPLKTYYDLVRLPQTSTPSSAPRRVYTHGRRREHSRRLQTGMGGNDSLYHLFSGKAAPGPDRR